MPFSCPSLVEGFLPTWNRVRSQTCYLRPHLIRFLRSDLLRGIALDPGHAHGSNVVRLSAPFSSPFLIAHSQTSIQGRNSKLRVGLRCLLSIGKEASNAMKGIFPISPLLLPVDWSFFPFQLLFWMESEFRWRRCSLIKRSLSKKDLPISTLLATDSDR